MARHPKYPDDETQRAADGFNAFVGEPKKSRSKKAGMSNAAWARATARVVEMKASGAWEGATPAHFVALYALQHEVVYGVAPCEMGPRERMYASAMASRMLAREFGGDASEMALFVKWTWDRERGREDWRRRTGASGGRVHWKSQFAGSILTDYRLDLARRVQRRA